MIKRSKLVWGSVFTVALAGLGAFFFLTGNRAPEKSFEEIRAIRGNISSAVSTTGVVEPQNRLKIQSSIGGRVEAILVAEGQYVKKGEVLALLSSTERAALLDAARVQGKSEEAYWKRVYKETSIIAPLDGQVIVRSIDPGQAVTTSDSLFVLSDHLIVKAYVDETDIGRVKVGQNAVIGLDAYPDIRVNGIVEHIYFESHLQNNVNIYNVDVIPERIPDVFRSGMSANIEILVQEKQGALLVPLGAVESHNGKTVVLQKKGGTERGVRYTSVTTGLQDDRHVEILEGLSDSAVVLLPDTSFVLPGKKGGSNPFAPQRNRTKK